MNKLSVIGQLDQDYQHVVIEDMAERGVSWANGAMASRDWSAIRGDYVMLLDDDDALAADNVLITIKTAAAVAWPDLIVVRMDHKERGILPAKNYIWGESLPPKGAIGCSAVIPKRALFMEAVGYYSPEYDGDYNYISACFKGAGSVTRLDLVASKVNQIGLLTGH